MAKMKRTESEATCPLVS